MGTTLFAGLKKNVRVVASESREERVVLKSPPVSCLITHSPHAAVTAADCMKNDCKIPPLVSNMQTEYFCMMMSKREVAPDPDRLRLRCERAGSSNLKAADWFPETGAENRGFKIRPKPI